MISIQNDIKLFLSTEPIDMRKAIDGLCMLVVDALNKNPQDKALYIFYNKARNKIKAIVWDGNGFMMLYKRLEKGRFKISKELKDNEVTLSSQELKWLLAGLDYRILSDNPDLIFTHYS